jgi:hypothetical protein
MSFQDFYPSGINLPHIFKNGKREKGRVQSQVKSIKNTACPLLSLPSSGLEIVLNRSNAITAFVAAPPIPENAPNKA